MVETFYATTAQVCFALLGLWWVVIQFKYDMCMRDPQRRRTAYNISLYFTLPGGMSLIAVLAAEVPLFWQVAFIVVGILGIFEAVQLVRKPLTAGHSLLSRVSPFATLLMYVLIVIFAIAPGILRGFGVTPLHVEGVLLGLVIVLGIQMAWNFFSELNGE